MLLFTETKFECLDWPTFAQKLFEKCPKYWMRCNKEKMWGMDLVGEITGDRSGCYWCRISFAVHVKQKHARLANVRKRIFHAHQCVCVEENVKLYSSRLGTGNNHFWTYPSCVLILSITWNLNIIYTLFVSNIGDTWW